MKKMLLCLLCALLLIQQARAISPLPEDSFDLGCTSAVLMERSTGTLLYAKTPTSVWLPPASPRS